MFVNHHAVHDYRFIHARPFELIKSSRSPHNIDIELRIRLTNGKCLRQSDIKYIRRSRRHWKLTGQTNSRWSPIICESQNEWQPRECNKALALRGKCRMLRKMCAYKISLRRAADGARRPDPSLSHCFKLCQINALDNVFPSGDKCLESLLTSIECIHVVMDECTVLLTFIAWLFFCSKIAREQQMICTATLSLSATSIGHCLVRSFMIVIKQ